MEHGTRQMTIGKVQICSLDPKTKNTKTPSLAKTRRIGQSKVQNRHSAETYGSGNIQVGLIVNRKMRKGGPPALWEKLKRIPPAPIARAGTAAIIIYIIVSEGSRLYPPRNLVPAP